MGLDIESIIHFVTVASQDWAVRSNGSSSWYESIIHFAPTAFAPVS